MFWAFCLQFVSAVEERQEMTGQEKEEWDCKKATSWDSDFGYPKAMAPTLIIIIY